jgi:hypothetical protein
MGEDFFRCIAAADNFWDFGILFVGLVVALFLPAPTERVRRILTTLRSQST